MTGLRLGGQRGLQIGFLVLLAICIAQVGWWMLDQWAFTEEVRQRIGAFYAQNERAAQLMVQSGVPEQTVREIFPLLKAEKSATDNDRSSAARDVGLHIGSEAFVQLDADRWRRVNRYVWEGGFFLFVLVAGMAVLSGAVRREALLRRRQQNFLAAVSHELKSPLASIRLAVETLDLRDPDSDHRRQLIGRVLGNLDRLERMVTNLLDAARIEEGKLAVAPRRLELGGALVAAGAGFEERGRRSGVTLTMDIEESLVIQADPELVDTVVRNLLENALEATASKGGGEIRVRARRFHDRIRVEVADDGCGFDPGEGDKLFEKFYRPGDEMSRDGKGSGLGLYIVRQLVRQSGGKVTAHSGGAQKGAIFTVTWPGAEDESE